MSRFTPRTIALLLFTGSPLLVHADPYGSAALDRSVCAALTTLLTLPWTLIYICLLLLLRERPGFRQSNRGLFLPLTMLLILINGYCVGREIYHTPAHWRGETMFDHFSGLLLFCTLVYIIAICLGWKTARYKG